MELQAASRYTKLFHASQAEQIENLKSALNSYEKARDFAKEYKKTGGELSADSTTQLKIAEEMIELLPVKISKILYNK